MAGWVPERSPVWPANRSAIPANGVPNVSATVKMLYVGAVSASPLFCANA
jgi:hypothetical protein